MTIAEKQHIAECAYKHGVITESECAEILDKLSQAEHMIIVTDITANELLEKMKSKQEKL